MPYSLDLRERVVAAVKSGMSKTKAAEIYNVCRQTIRRWVVQDEETGSLKPITGFQKGHSHGITDLDYFKQYIDSNSDLTQEEIAIHFNVSSSTVSRTLQRLGYTRKKRAKHTQKDVMNHERNI